MRSELSDWSATEQGLLCSLGVYESVLKFCKFALSDNQTKNAILAADFKTGIGFLLRQMPFFWSQRWALLAKVTVFGPQKMALLVAKSKF